MDARVKDFEKLGDAGRKFLIQVANDRRSPLERRWRAITTMGRWSAASFRNEIEGYLKSPDWFMRNAALIAILNDERSRAIGWSVRLLEDRALVVRTQAVRNLIGLNAREVEGRLWHEISHRRNFRGSDSLWVRAHLAEALARLTSRGTPQALRFKQLLLDPDERLHRWAIMGLESTTGFKMSNDREPLEIRRQKWLARLGAEDV